MAEKFHKITDPEAFSREMEKLRTLTPSYHYLPSYIDDLLTEEGRGEYPSMKMYTMAYPIMKNWNRRPPTPEEMLWVNQLFVVLDVFDSPISTRLIKSYIANYGTHFPHSGTDS